MVSMLLVIHAPLLEKQHPLVSEKQHPLVSEKQQPPRSEKQHPPLLEKQHPPLSLKQQPGVSLMLSHGPDASTDMGSVLAYPSSSSRCSRDGLGRGMITYPSPARSPAVSSSPKLLQELHEPSVSPASRTEGRDEDGGVRTAVPGFPDAKAVEDVSRSAGLTVPPAAVWLRAFSPGT
ncbi:hypothetical protein LY78DRAFT_685437 [Colletotrichum sublineola]|nr:hypothetical protein LY78DRAFT_685437 [Colletotrichum sublineola]